MWQCDVYQVDTGQYRGVMRPIVLCFLSIWSVGEQIACTFPRQWRGRYFQSGLGDVFIRDHAITTKGHCVQHNRDYFLLHSRSVYVIHCFYFAPSRPGIVFGSLCVCSLLVNNSPKKLSSSNSCRDL